MSRPRHSLRDPAVTHVLNGGAPKTFAADNGVSIVWVCRTLWNAGIKRQFLTDDEWQLIRQRRQQQFVSSTQQSTDNK